jgi:hypothetical protein
VNALIALLWKPHPFHEACIKWMGKARNSGWATCAITEAGLVRVICNPSFTPAPPSVHAAIALLTAATESQPGHHFWKDEIPVSSLGLRWKPPLGHKQITDAYLLSLAQHHKGTIVTFDLRMQHLAKAGRIESDAVIMLKQ